MSRTFEIAFFVIAAVTLISAIWIVIPAPASAVWLFAVAASEWSLWIAIFALSSILPNLFVLIFRNGGKMSVASLVIATIAFVISFYPFVSTVSVARANVVSLSATRYFAGLSNIFSTKDAVRPKTYTFANINGRELKLDVYLPTQTTPNSGAGVIVVHGGSWAGGERSDFPQWNAMLAENGFTVFDIDYRLAPQPNYLIATADIKCAIAWVQQHSGECDISPDRIALLGRSAGAHLALLAAYSNGDDRLPLSCSDKNPPVNVRAVVSLYGPTDLLWAFDNPANQSVIDGPQTLSNFLGGSPHTSDEIRERYIVASPTSHVTAASPPTLIIHGGQDQLVREENLAFLDQKLSDANVTHQTLFIPYAQHGYDYNINGWGSQVTEKVMLEFLSIQLR